MVYRVYVEKKEGFGPEAAGLLEELKDFLGIKGIEGLRVVVRYDVEDIEKELFEYAKTTVFSEPQIDNVAEELDTQGADRVFAVEPLPGQYDQRADSAAQCIQLLSMGNRPIVKAAKVYLIKGTVTDDELKKIKSYVINPVESREAELSVPETLKQNYTEPPMVKTVEGFITMSDEELDGLRDSLGLAMDANDLQFLRNYFRDDEHRDPTMTEIRIIDTYWSDHCRHTTFSTHIEDVDIEREDVKDAYERYLGLREEVYGERAKTRPRTLMDMATIGAKALKKRGYLKNIDVSEEINACSIKIPVDVDGEKQDWLLMFKNETHNHPTEIEPFGGAATCIGGCIRDPLSGRAYVHQAMRVTGCGDPRKSLAETVEGKLPQRQLARTAAAGYSSYGNQIGLATGHVAEIYHDGYVAKHMECGVVVAAALEENVVREVPAPGDVVILLGGRTGRDGIGGATGSSKSHNKKSLVTMASEVQKGNAPEERKLQRLFRNPEVTKLIKRCNDFGAGGVCVAIGELADGLVIDLDAVRKKYEGLDGTELSISESQERMAVVIKAEDAEKFIAEANRENLEAYQVAVVTEEPRMVLSWRGREIANISREFLNTNGAEKHMNVEIKNNAGVKREVSDNLTEAAADLKVASRRGLVERFDSTVGAGSILMPFGGKTQRTPEDVMAALIPVLPGSHTDDGSVMSWGFDPDNMTADPYKGAYESVYESVAKLVAGGADYREAYLTFQEFFEKLGDKPLRWGKPFMALLGALDAQLELKIAAIGGKDSMSGSFMDMDVPPTLISFAIAPIKAGNVISSEFKASGNPVYVFTAAEGVSKTDMFEAFHEFTSNGAVLAARIVGNTGFETAVMNMAFGNEIGFKGNAPVVKPGVTSIVAEFKKEITSEFAEKVGETVSEATITIGDKSYSVSELLKINESVLEDVYPTRAKGEGSTEVKAYTGDDRKAPAVLTARPKVAIPVFPGTNCEYDTARTFVDAGAEPEILVVRNLSSSDVERSVEDFARLVKESQIIAIPGGFSGGDEPDGSAKFITAFFRNPEIKANVTELLEERDGLMLGICNGFQALIKLGLVPYGKIVDTDADCATLTYNTIGRHQSMLCRTKVVSNKSPWLKGVNPGDIITVPISHGEGRFIAPESLINELEANGQIATQYVDMAGNPTMETAFNPNASFRAIEGITSPDGRVLGKMGHSERIGRDLYRNVPGIYDMKLFESAVKYFKG
ncbi:MAG: phosphoribosylformylglycinamidine synthase [Eubacteriales bacterium]|nr:phosphoribosylformylglycinamidine synthase [Eubacteriales bacterium]